MFESSPTPLLLSEARVQVLRVSMNAPVVNIKELPVGPAQAAIVLFAEEYGGLRLALGVRSKESGTSVLFRHAGQAKELRKPGVAMNAALSFAEGMGFLFDDDLVRSDGKAVALAEWEKLMGEGEASVAGDHPDETPDLEPVTSDELLLDHVAQDLGGGLEPVAEEPLDVLEASSDLLGEFDADSEDLRPAGGTGAALAAHSEPPPPAVEEFDGPDLASVPPQEFDAASGSATLSKFRRRAGDIDIAEGSEERAEEMSGPPGNPLGRIALVRRRIDTDGPVKPNVLLRIVSHF